VVFIVVQNLVGIGAAVSIICQFLRFEFSMKMHIYAPLFFYEFDPLDESRYQ